MSQQQSPSDPKPDVDLPLESGAQKEPTSSSELKTVQDGNLIFHGTEAECQEFQKSMEIYKQLAKENPQVAEVLKILQAPPPMTMSAGSEEKAEVQENSNGVVVHFVTPMIGKNEQDHHETAEVNSLAHPAETEPQEVSPQKRFSEPTEQSISGRVDNEPREQKKTLPQQGAPNQKSAPRLPLTAERPQNSMMELLMKAALKKVEAMQEYAKQHAKVASRGGR